MFENRQISFTIVTFLLVSQFLWGCEDTTDAGDTGNGDSEELSTDSDEVIEDGFLNILEDGTLLDEARGLQWQNPSGANGKIFFYPGANKHCNNLVIGENDDWRIPTLDEIRTLIDGVSTTTAGGFCPTSEECFRYTSCSTNPKNSDACSGCSAITGKHLTEEDCNRDVDGGECYWPSPLEGTCGTYWTTTKTGVPTGRYSISFFSGSIRAGVESASKQNVRCVRNYP